jgi:hypothetical protein
MLKRTTSIRKLAHSVTTPESTTPVHCTFSVVIVTVVDVAHHVFEEAGKGGLVLKWHRGAGKKDRGSTPVVKLYPSTTSSLTVVSGPSSSGTLRSPRSSPAGSSSSGNTGDDTRFYTADFQSVANTLRFQGESCQFTFNCTLFKNRQDAFESRPFTFKLCLATESTGTQSLKTIGTATLELSEYPPPTTQQLAILTFVLKEPRSLTRRPKLHLRVSSEPGKPQEAEAKAAPASSSSKGSSRKSRSKGSKSSGGGDTAKLEDEIKSLRERIRQLESELEAKTKLIHTKDLEMERMIQQMSKINALMADRD